ncbi:MAG: (E)-4-hydroxy-3-methylbut-2-enyl-diphosphate synthase, partial [Spirochaetaceae bacterium]|nr:(E)-4-hydroxy-3-methylbut-2-enyl-diphosphate synthase [Spirochaetaceae bacterium]
MADRRTRTVIVGGGRGEPVALGGDNPIAIQTMWKDPLTREGLCGAAGDTLIARINALAASGARLLRFAVPTLDDAALVGELAGMVTLPLVADIHFDYKIALRALDYPIAKLRINPGNIGAKEHVVQVLDKAAAHNVPVRIGVNAGSIPADLRKRIAAGEIDRVQALVEAALRELDVFARENFDAVLVSLKASSVSETIAANRLFAQHTDIPLHIGVTEAGPLVAGLVRSTAALYTLLLENIGDTVRVSLSDTAENEVIAAREIIAAVYECLPDADNRCKGMTGIRIVSCPRCGRCAFDTHAFTARWISRLYALEKEATIAIMGCAVNGP